MYSAKFLSDTPPTAAMVSSGGRMARIAVMPEGVEHAGREELQVGGALARRGERFPWG